MDRPLFRVSNAYEFDSKVVVNDDGLLTNVHEGLPSSGSKCRNLKFSCIIKGVI